MRIGSRGSPLALAQSHLMAAALARVSARPEADFPIQSFVTSGDRIADRRLQDAGGKGLFTKELDEALLDRRIDLAVHSLKDLPTHLPEGIALAAVPAREDPRDAFIGRTAKDLSDLPAGAVVGTASLRRQAQTLHLRPDLKIVTLRGSVQTRLKRLANGDVDATFLALAGLRRLGLTAHVTALVDEEAMPPAPGQGALAITCRADDTNAMALAARVNRIESQIAVTAERAFLAALDGSCRTPIGGLARVVEGRLTFLGEILSPDGARRWRRREEIALGPDPADAVALGLRLGRAIRAEAGEDFIQSLEKRGW